MSILAPHNKDISGEIIQENVESTHWINIFSDEIDQKCRISQLGKYIFLSQYVARFETKMSNLTT